MQRFSLGLCPQDTKPHVYRFRIHVQVFAAPSPTCSAHVFSIATSALVPTTPHIIATRGSGFSIMSATLHTSAFLTMVTPLYLPAFLAWPHVCAPAPLPRSAMGPTIRCPAHLDISAFLPMRFGRLHVDCPWCVRLFAAPWTPHPRPHPHFGYLCTILGLSITLRTCWVMRTGCLSAFLCFPAACVHALLPATHLVFLYAFSYDGYTSVFVFALMSHSIHQVRLRRLSIVLPPENRCLWYPLATTASTLLW